MATTSPGVNPPAVNSLARSPFPGLPGAPRTVPTPGPSADGLPALIIACVTRYPPSNMKFLLIDQPLPSDILSSEPTKLRSPPRPSLISSFSKQTAGPHLVFGIMTFCSCLLFQVESSWLNPGYVLTVPLLTVYGKSATH